MLSFTGVGQVQRHLKGWDKTFGNTTSRKYEVLASTNPAGVAYDGESPFDNYTVTIQCPSSRQELFDVIVPGAVIWIQNGSVLSFTRKSAKGELWWNTTLAAKITDIMVMYHTPLGPSYDEHLRVYDNRKRYRKTI